MNTARSLLSISLLFCLITDGRIPDILCIAQLFDTVIRRAQKVTYGSTLGWMEEGFHCEGKVKNPPRDHPHTCVRRVSGKLIEVLNHAPAVNGVERLFP